MLTYLLSGLFEVRCPTLILHLWGGTTNIASPKRNCLDKMFSAAPLVDWCGGAMYPENWKKFGLVGRLRLLSGTLIPGISVSKLGDIQIYISPKSISQISASLDLFLSLKRITDNIATRSMVGANMAIQKKGSRTMNVGRLGVHTKKQPKNKRWPDETHFTSQRGKKRHVQKVPRNNAKCSFKRRNFWRSKNWGPRARYTKAPGTVSSLRQVRWNGAEILRKLKFQLISTYKSWKKRKLFLEQI